MIVMMTAITPSVKASSLPFSMTLLPRNDFAHPKCVKGQKSKVNKSRLVLTFDL
jgi:hypothetical protein